MELKQAIRIPKVLREAAFNRTFMELKRRQFRRHTLQGRAFNRTFMELKQYLVKELYRVMWSF